MDALTLQGVFSALGAMVFARRDVPHARLLLVGHTAPTVAASLPSYQSRAMKIRSSGERQRTGRGSRRDGAEFGFGGEPPDAVALRGGQKYYWQEGKERKRS